MTDLSENARIVLGSSFAWGQVLTYHMVESVPSPEMQKALDELVAAGMLKEERGLEDMSKRAVRYRLADGVDVGPFRKEAWARIENNTTPSIRVFIPKAGAA
jgi:hypothetical protein